VKIMTELHPRECLVRLLSNGQIAPAIKVRTMDAPQGPAHRPAALKPTKQVQVLPTKFVEGSNVPARQIKFSKALMDKIVDNENEGTPKYESQPARFGSVRDLLAMHSSSRNKVTKQKDNE
jgi:hypothetical protein